MKIYSFIVSIICLLCFNQVLSAEEITGFWKTINDKTGQPESIIAIYEYQGKFYGRIMATYDEAGQLQDTIDSPKEHTQAIEGNPFYSGLDIIWNLKKNGDRYSDGKILDPEKGRLYNAEMWKKGNNLIVRGEIWVFGENEEWLPVADSDFPQDLKKPNITQFVPSIPKVKHNSHSEK